MSHNLIFPSQEAEARMWSSEGDHSTHVTPDVWPFRTCVLSPHDGSHSLGQNRGERGWRKRRRRRREDVEEEEREEEKEGK